MKMCDTLHALIIIIFLLENDMWGLGCYILSGGYKGFNNGLSFGNDLEVLGLDSVT